jgi:ADP-dependent NAD(P)H-hydrate dehydratase / NAD(P)H-hydrate epimerase
LKVLNVQQLKAADAATIEEEPVAAIDLMERAAQQCVNWLLKQPLAGKPIFIFCGKGGNGGDGLAIARLLAGSGIESIVYILEFGKLGTAEFQTNLARLHQLTVSLHFIQSEDQFPQIPPASIIIDALYGFGLNKPLDGLSAALVQHLNAAGAEIVAIDLPSGLFADTSSIGNTVIHATHTLTFECYKLGLLVAENAPFIGDVHVLHIHLYPPFLQSLETDFSLTDELLIKGILKPRNRFAHKGTFGHALMIGGSYGKMGAMVLATSACLRSGAGLVTTYIPKCGYTILQTTAPEAMTMTDDAETFLSKPPASIEHFTALGIGPGMGTEAETGKVLQTILTNYKRPVVLDADALNLLSQQQNLLSQLFQNTILTPHPKEFERLFGTCASDFEHISLARQKAAELQIMIVLKGHHTLIALPDGKTFFNTTGNAGMAKGGSGDVLTGILTSLLAQHYTPAEAALLGVYLHGLAGDFAAQALSPEAMTAGDLVTFLSQVFSKLHQ